MSNRPRTGVVLLAALLGITLGCGASLPGGPTPTPVTPGPVAPAPVAPNGYTVTAGTIAVAPGGQLSVSWTAGIAWPTDWISLFRVGDADIAHGWVKSTDGAASGTFTLSAPTQAGQYEFRYLLEDFSVAARSSLVTVGVGL